MVAKRLGVGAASPSATAGGASENVSEDWTKSIKKQILNVGKKRRHDNIYGEDDNDDDNDADDGNSSSDEEEGRTTAVKERKKKKTTVPVVSTDASPSLVVQGDVTTNDDTKSKKKKKKKGKKERIQEQQAEQDAAAAESTKEGEVAAPSSDKEQTTDVTNTTESKKPNQKRKRPKVRSRQKNIAKDTRAANDKPSHLVPGRDDYAGRAMTQTTRGKLGLGKSKSSRRSKKSVKLDDAFEKGEWVDEDGLKEEGKSPSKVDVAPDPVDAKSPADNNNDVGESVEKQKESSKEENKLQMIGDCIVDYEPSSSTPAKKKKKKDKKKKKYKNV